MRAAPAAAGAHVPEVAARVVPADARRMNEHTTPPAATLHVLRGRVRLTSGGGDTELGAGQLLVIPKERHGLLALDDAAVLLTTVTSVP
ncbi:cupin domain-containing protein [Streptomyces sp. NPDC059708]|uniref:cupin domain-containing protein n=1 Tax=Streptomyces sp. NPDC059708 TaxID=3346916 RepID=UPI0036CA2C0E